VSGAVFEANDKSIKRMVGDQPFYFCCEGCAGYFDEHRDEVIALRGYVKGSG
jgi:hypothetical protein